MAYSIFIADDQVPPEDISEDAFAKQIYSKYGKSKNNAGFVEQCLFMGKIVSTLRDYGYVVITANKYKTAVNTIKKEFFDLAIVDLGWYMDDSLPDKERPAAGWSLCDLIDQKDQENGTFTPQIVFSSRFTKEPELSRRAAQQKKLPLFKESSEFVKNSLLATIQFIESTKMVAHSDPKAVDNTYYKKLQDLVIDSFREPLRNHRHWTILTLVFVSLSLGALICGIVLAFFNRIEIGIITSVASILSGIISTILYKRLSVAQKMMENSRKEILTQINRAVP